MLRFIIVIIRNLLPIMYYTPLMIKYAKHPERYSPEQCYHVVQRVITLIKNRGHIRTKVSGTKNLPKHGGYIMYANHQGKYDALGIMDAHEKPCKVVMDMKRSKAPISSQVIDVLKSKRLDLTDIRQQAAVMREIIDEVKAGERYLIFPEGGYSDNHNRLQKWKVGSFKYAMKAMCPIVPVAIYDSYKPFELNSYRWIETQVHFLEAIPYEMYKDMSTIEINELVTAQIEKRIRQIEILKNIS